MSGYMDLMRSTILFIGPCFPGNPFPKTKFNFIFIVAFSREVVKNENNFRKVLKFIFEYDLSLIHIFAVVLEPEEALPPSPSEELPLPQDARIIEPTKAVRTSFVNMVFFILESSFYCRMISHCVKGQLLCISPPFLKITGYFW